MSNIRGFSDFKKDDKKSPNVGNYEGGKSSGMETVGPHDADKVIKMAGTGNNYV
jgi:hypothetical protein